MDRCTTPLVRSASAHNDTVHRAAVKDVDFRTRAARASVCNGLLFVSSRYWLRSCRRNTISDSMRATIDESCT